MSRPVSHVDGLPWCETSDYVMPAGNLADDAEWCLRCHEAEDRWGRCRCARARDEVAGPEPFVAYVAAWGGGDA